MKPDVLVANLEGYAVRVTERPDGSILLKFVSSDGKTIERVAGKISDITATVRSIKFDVAYEAGEDHLSDAVKYCCSAATLPTYSQNPIFRTQSSRLWDIRKIREK